jgi:hypothetical protein
MKRILFYLFTLITVLSFTSAMAVSVEYHGSAALGVMAVSNARVLNRGNLIAAPSQPEEAVLGSGKFRLRTEITSDDKKSKFVYGAETGANDFGRDWDFSGDSIDFENRFAYVQSAVPGLHEKTFIRGGLQATGINKWLWTETAGGITLHGENNKKWMAGWYRGVEADLSVDNDDSDLFVGKIDFEPYKNWKFNCFGVYAFDFLRTNVAQADSDQYWLGVNGNLSRDKGKFFATADLIYQGGDMSNGNKVSGVLANAVVGKKLDEKLKVSLNTLYLSGDDDPADAETNNFQSIDVDINISQIFFEGGLAGILDKFVTDSPHKLANGFLSYGVDADYKICPKSKIRGAITYLSSDDDVTLANGEKETELGYELDLWYAYEMNKNLTYKVEGAYLFADTLSHEIFGSLDDVYMLTSGAQFKF